MDFLQFSDKNYIKNYFKILKLYFQVKRLYYMLI